MRSLIEVFPGSHVRRYVFVKLGLINHQSLILKLNYSALRKCFIKCFRFDIKLKLSPETYKPRFEKRDRYSVSGQRRSNIASAPSDQGLRCPFTKSLDIENISTNTEGANQSAPGGGGGGGGGGRGGECACRMAPFSALTGIWLAPFLQQKVYD